MKTENIFCEVLSGYLFVEVGEDFLKGESLKKFYFFVVPQKSVFFVSYSKNIKMLQIFDRLAFHAGRSLKGTLASSVDPGLIRVYTVCVKYRNFCYM